MTRYSRLQETRQLRREGADWLAWLVWSVLLTGLPIACVLAHQWASRGMG